MWQVSIGFSPDEQGVEERPRAIAGALEARGAAVRIGRGCDDCEVVMSVEAGSAAEAALAADSLVRAVSDAVIGAISVRSLRAQAEACERRGEREPVFPEVVGFAEIAAMAGVTRQRARQFVKIRAFPAPVIVTAQGPLMEKAAVELWLETRNTRPGRPRAVMPSGEAAPSVAG